MINQKGEKTEKRKTEKTDENGRRETLLLGAKTSPKIWQAFPAPRQCRGVSPEFNLLRQEESTAKWRKMPPKIWAAFPAPRQLRGVSPEFNLLRQEVPYQYKSGREKGGTPAIQRGLLGFRLTSPSRGGKRKTRKHTMGLSPIVAPWDIIAQGLLPATTKTYQCMSHDLLSHGVQVLPAPSNDA